MYFCYRNQDTGSNPTILFFIYVSGKYIPVLSNLILFYTGTKVPYQWQTFHFLLPYLNYHMSQLNVNVKMNSPLSPLSFPLTHSL
jgi:hypothetical protein